MKEKILVIDGHPIYIYKLEGFLRGLTYNNISLARTGEEGLARLETEKPDLVILSGMMPDMNSLEICQRIKKTLDSVKIIVQIGLLTDKMIISKFVQFGADAVLARKEKDLEPLQNAIEELLKSKSIQRI